MQASRENDKLEVDRESLAGLHKAVGEGADHGSGVGTEAQHSSPQQRVYREYQHRGCQGREAAKVSRGLAILAVWGGPQGEPKQ